MGGKKYVTDEIEEVSLIYGRAMPLTEVEQMFNKIRINHLQRYSNITVEFYEWEGNSDHGFEPEAHATFYGERLETDEEYQKRLIIEEQQRLRQIELDKEEAEREKIRQARQKEFDEQEFDRLKKKYGW